MTVVTHVTLVTLLQGMWVSVECCTLTKEILESTGMTLQKTSVSNYCLE